MTRRDLLPSPMNESLFLIRLASLLVPSFLRAEWRREWEAEIWHCAMLLRERGDEPARVRSRLRALCRGSFADAAWHRTNALDRETLTRPLSRWSQSAAFCLLLLAALIALIALASNFLPTTRAILLPLPYANAERIATVSQSGLSFSVRSAIPGNWPGIWRRKSRMLEDVATYAWGNSDLTENSGRRRIVNARVSDNFFSLLGAGAARGRVFRANDAAVCPDCIVLSYDFWRGGYRGSPVRIGSYLTLDGKRRRIIGVLPKRFWFLSRDIAVWSISTADERMRTGVVVRLGPEVTKQMAQAELQTITHEAGFALLNSIVDVSPLQDRVRWVFGSFALALALAIVITIAGLHPHIPSLDQLSFKSEGRRRCRQLLFFCAKTLLLLAAVLIAGIEFTRASSITMIGGTDVLTEPLSTWLFLIGCMGVLSWSIYDQRRRCRVCLRRLGLAAHVGCSGCLLLNWAGTEMVCIEGHGMLHVPEMISSWQRSERWTRLDDSWQELFARKAQ